MSYKSLNRDGTCIPHGVYAPLCEKCKRADELHEFLKRVAWWGVPILGILLWLELSDWRNIFALILGLLLAAVLLGVLILANLVSPFALFVYVAKIGELLGKKKR